MRGTLAKNTQQPTWLSTTTSYLYNSATKKMKKLFLISTAVLLTLTVVHSQPGWHYYYLSFAYNNNSYSIFPVNKDIVYLMLDSGRVEKTTDGGLSWTVRYNGFYNSKEMAFCNPDTGFAAGTQGSIIRTFDGGNTWTLLNTGVTRNLSSITIVKGSNEIWAVGDTGTILHSNDYGATWKRKDTLTTKLLSSIRFRNSTVGFIAGDGGRILKTTNGGITWDTMHVATSMDLLSLSVTEHYVYALAGNYYNYDSLLKSGDDINFGIVNATINPNYTMLNKLCFTNDSCGFNIGIAGLTCYCPNPLYILKTTDHGNTWVCSLDGSEPWNFGRGADIAFVNDTVGYAAAGTQIIITKDGGTCTLVSADEMVRENFISFSPNPFSNQTTMQVKDPLIKAILTVDNIFGQTVAQIENISGETITFNRDNLANGLYFVRLTAENKTIAVAKLVITDK